ncbi:MAG: hypothetical protein M0R80_24340 [Proteobacteria bacterium]|jgi:hypothetical protein|nr:hypothetical protein [Pseudomonadota bacterium]
MPNSQLEITRIGSRMIRGGILLFGLFFFHPESAEAQWVNAYSASQNDVVESVAWVDEPTLGKAIAIAGHSNSFSEDDSTQAWVALIDPGGDYLWSNLYGLSTLAQAISPVVDEAGLLQSLAVAGFRNGAWLMEIKPDTGDVSWQCEYPGLSIANAVVPTGDGQFVFAGSVTEPGGSAVFVAKTLRTAFNPCGLSWIEVFGEGDDETDEAMAISATSDGGYIVAGTTRRYSANGDGIVFKLSPDGTPQWQSTLSSTISPVNGHVDFQDVIEVRDSEGYPDGYLAVGSFWFLDGGWDLNMVLTRLNPADGSERWTKLLGYGDDGESVSAFGVVQSPDGAFSIVGDGRSPPPGPWIHEDLLILKAREYVDGLGQPSLEIEWQHELNSGEIGDNEFAWARSVTGTPGGGLIVGGFYSNAPFMDKDPLLMRLNEEGDIPPDCLVDANPSLEETFHDYVLEPILDEPESVTPTAGTETAETPTPQVLLLRYGCSPCVKHVNVNIPPEMAGDGETWETAIADLQEGIDAAEAEIIGPSGGPGYCEVWVARGDYYVYDDDPSNTIQMKAGVHVYGGFSGGTPPDSYGWEGSRDDRNWEWNVTRIIGADGPTPTARVHHVVTAPITNPSTLDGFHVLGGRANGDPGLDRWGGGMVNVFSSPKIANCTFYDNIAWWGGAMANVFAAPDVVSCTFKTSHNDPGFNQPNAAFAGGAIFNWGWAPWSGDGPTVDGCTFADNYAKYYYGGAIHNQNSPAEIVDSTFIGNHAYAGGAVSIGQTVDGMGAPSIEACTFNDNVASRWWDTNNGGFGGATAAFFGQYVYSEYTTVENSLFDNNSTGSQTGGAIAAVTLSGTPKVSLVNCTIADNWTGGVSWYAESTSGAPPVVYNSILWTNGPYEISPDCDSGAIVYYTDVMGGAGCEGFAGNLGDDPADDPDFGSGTYHLEWDSPCIDTANPAAAPLTDLDGEYRDSLPDMGAYEFFPEEEE